jgi:hypothetical protein
MSNFISIADAFGAAKDALDAAEKKYDDARAAVISTGRDVLVGQHYTVNVDLSETLTFTVEGLLAAGFKAGDIAKLQRVSLDTTAVRKALKAADKNPVEVASSRKVVTKVEATAHPVAIAA